ncbi:protein MAIN-LIKE 1-like [Tripterygium wilfordii]|uniref:protein MAIN-LIKE 1-like n=1 Tax=Tripterygium wilfordii TaxID=458696 RepID=UPI0018F83322|nr:protein MAIN-LIKE 1-like [Tripterygium wilfordii]
MEVYKRKRNRPTASALRAHTQQIQGETGGSNDDNNPQMEDVVAHENIETPPLQADASHSTDVPEETSFLYGPRILDVIPNFSHHIACRISKGNERESIRMHSHGSKLLEWKIPVTATRFRALIDRSGLSVLASCTFAHCDRWLKSALLERWYLDTNTLHFRFGEMTVTLDDVSSLLHIPIEGHAVVAHRLTTTTTIALLSDALGGSIDEAVSTLEGGTGHTVKLEWLRVQFSGVDDSCSQEQIVSCARAYLLYLLGCTLFVGKSGTRVHAHYLHMFMDIDSVRDYAWGAAALCHLYLQLGDATKDDTRQVAGYLTLLEAWAYEHFPRVRPIRCPSIVRYYEDSPRASRWIDRDIPGGGVDLGRATRLIFDTMSSQEVVWEPYRDARHFHPFHDISFFTGCIPFINVVEPYGPERVLHQFGRVQIIPPIPLSHNSRRESIRRGKRKADVIHVQTWDRWRSHLLDDTLRSVPVGMDGIDCIDGFMEWYVPRTHLYVHPVQFPDAVPLPQPRPWGVANIQAYDRLQQAAQEVYDIGHDVVGRGSGYYMDSGVNDLVDQFERITRILNDTGLLHLV